MKVLLNSFHLNGHTLGLYPHISKLEPPFSSKSEVDGVEAVQKTCESIQCGPSNPM